MKTNFFRKGISLVLAIAMLISILPQTQVFAAPSSKITFTFANAETKLGAEGTDWSYWTTAQGASKANTYVNLRSLKNYYSNGTDVRNWRYFDDTMVNKDAAKPFGGLYSASGGTWATGSATTWGNWLAFKVKGLHTSSYNVSFTALDTRGCVIGMYVLDNAVYGNSTTAEITEALANSSNGVTKVGELDFFGAAKGTKMQFGSVTLSGSESTEHIVVFKMEGAGTLDEGETSEKTSSEPRLYINSLVFEEIEVLAEIRGSKTSATVGEEVLPDFSWISTSGAECAAEKVIDEIVFTENDDGAVLQGSNGKLYAVKAGQAKLYIKGSLASGLGGSKTSDEITVTVSENSRAFNGESVYFDLSAVNLVKKELFEESEYTNPPTNSAVYTRALDEYCENGTYLRNWKYFGQTLPGNMETTSADGTRYTGGKLEQWTAFKVKGVPKGSYNIILNKKAEHDRGCVWEMYVLDAALYENCSTEEITAAVEELRAGVQRAGEVDNYASTASALKFGVADFAGDENSEYILLLRAERYGAVDAGEKEPSTQKSEVHFKIQGITLDGNYIADINTELEYTQLGVGEETKIISTTGRKNTGESISDVSELGYVNYAIVEGSEFAEISKDGKKIITKKEGTAVLETTAFIDGCIVTDRDTIAVADEFGIASVSLKGNTTAYLGNQFRLVPVTVTGNGSEIVPADAEISYTIDAKYADIVTASGDTLIAGNVAGAAEVALSITCRGVTIKSGKIALSVTDKLEPLSGKTAEVALGGLAVESENAAIGAVKFNVPETGRYQLTLTASCNKKSGMLDFYAIPYSEAAEKNPEMYLYGGYKLAGANLYSSPAAVRDIMLEDAVFDELGEYLLVAVINGKNGASEGYEAAMEKLTLDGVSVISDVMIDVYSPRLGPGDETEFEIYAYLSNGASVPVEMAELSFEYNVDELTVDVDTLTLKTNEENQDPKSSDLAVTVTYKDYSATGTTTIKIDELYGVNADKLPYLYGDTVVSTGNYLDINPAFELNDQTVVKAVGCEVEYVLENNEDGVLALFSDNTDVKALKPGEASVYANVKFRGKTYKTETVEITVVEQELSTANIDINFTKGGHAGDGFEKLNDVTSYTSARSWVFDSVVGKSPVYTMSMQTEYANLVFDTTEARQYIVLRMKVPGSGVFNVTAFSNWCRFRTGRWDMYIFPATKEAAADIPACLVSDNFVGYMDFYIKGSQGESGEVLTVNDSYEFTGGGEYYVVLNLVVGASGKLQDSAGDQMCPTYISFRNVEAMDAAKLTTEKSAVDIGETVSGNIEMYNCMGEKLSATPDSIVYRSSDTSVAIVDENGNITGVGEGKATIRAVVYYGGAAKSVSCEVSVSDVSELLDITLSADKSIYVYGDTDLSAIAQMSSTNKIDIPYEYIEWTLSDDSIAEIDAERGKLRGKALGQVTVSAKIKEGYKAGAESLIVEPITVNVVWDSTIDPAIYTIKERENVKTNTNRYSWARSKVKSTVEKADKYLANAEAIFALTIPEGVPRSYFVGHRYDPQCYNCRYCGEYLGSIYSFITEPVSRPWKIQCPECKRLFPSNDFGSFYELGVSEDGLQWNYEVALQKHHELFVCEYVKNGEECNHISPASTAPTPGGKEWMAADPRDEAWYEYYGYNVEGGYLTNDLYEEMDEKLGVSGWGVDDGFGYRQPYVSDPTLPGYDASYYDGGDGYARYVYNSTKNAPIQHTYISYYLHEGIWYGAGGKPAAATVKNALTAFRDAFLYTGDAKYGRAGAILLDKIADIYPSFDLWQWNEFHKIDKRGTMTDRIWSHNLAELFASSYDAFLPIYNDSYVIDYLSQNSAKYKADESGSFILDENGEKIPTNLKNNPGAVRQNAEDGICRAVFTHAKRGNINGNFGTHQRSVTTAALALNKMPETGEMLDWLLKYSIEYGSGDYTKDNEGGNFVIKLINDVDRDGHGNENSPHYNYTWYMHISEVADMLEDYDKYTKVNLLDNPKFLKMVGAQLKLTLGGYYTPSIGDTNGTASIGFSADLTSMLNVYKHTHDRELAQMIWLYNELQNGGDTEKLRGTLFDDDAEKVIRDIEAVIEEDGELSLGSEMLTGWGFAALRAGSGYDSASASTKMNNTRDFAVYFGGTSGHGHSGALDLSISAFGLNMAPDLGYPEQTGTQPNRYQWVKNTIAHNTVVVNEKEQLAKSAAGHTPYHFDDAGRVKLMDVSADVYTGVNEYRRAVVMVDANDDVSYAVDFFHVNGSEDHLYSFHSQSDEIVYTEGLGEVESYPTVEQPDGTLVGTYAGPNVPFGPDPGGNSPKNIYPSGYTWLKNVRTYNSPEKDFAVEFKVKDWRKVLDSNKDLRLRLTMVGEEPMNEVSFVTGLPPQIDRNDDIAELEYLLVRNKGKNLDTTFTTVFEPYENGKKYISDIQKVPMVRDDNSRPGLYDSYSAVKITHTNGHVDYVMYSTNTEANYVIKDGEVEIEFRGFAGVMTVGKDENGKSEVLYSYLNDGDVLKLAEEAGSEGARLPAYTGEVVSFTTDLTTENYITVEFNEGQTPDMSELSGRYIYIDNSGVENGVYKIERATRTENGAELYLGNVSLIQRLVDETDHESGYIYNIKEGESFRIPVSYKYDPSPLIDPIDEVTVSAGSSVTIPFDATSPTGKTLTFNNSILPRGMSVNADAQTLTWKPDSSQVGENHVALIASDGTLETAVHFTVTVYGSTTSKPSTDNSGTSGEGASSGGSGGAGGGGGGAAPAEKPDDATNTDETDNNDATPQPDVGNTVPKFTDLANHTWAADAINTLAADGIIRGTSETTFSPANNITRADFALLLVRAFNLTSDNTENFADVSASDYFVSELAIARNTGIVGGIGDNKYAPRNSITRQDMMVIVYRAMQNMGVGFGVYDEPQYPDFDTVADYAKEAVSALISAGLVNGKSGRIAPTDYTTRAEVTVLIKRILDYVK